MISLNGVFISALLPNFHSNVHELENTRFIRQPPINIASWNKMLSQFEELISKSGNVH